MSFMRLQLLLCLCCIRLSCCGEIEQEFNELKDSFYIKFHKAFETERIKEKYARNQLWSFSSEKPLVEQHMQVTSLTPSKSLDVMRVATWTPISDINKDYLFYASDKGMNAFVEFNANSGETKYWWQKDGEASINAIPIKSLFFKHYQGIYVVVLYRKLIMTMSNVEEVHELIAYRIYRKGPQRIQRIIVNGMADFDLVHEKDNVYLVLSTTYRVLSLSAIQESTVRLYNWRRTQFDSIAEYRSKSEFNSVRMFVISSVVYIATAQTGRLDDKGIVKGSAILSYNSRDNVQKLKFLQFIRTNSNLKVQYFKANGNNYLVLIGSDEAMLAWWNGHHFLLYQTIKNTANAKDVSIMLLPHKEVILCFLFEYKIKFFSQISHFEFTETYTKSLEGEYLSGVKINNVQLRAFREQKFFAFFTYSFPPNVKSTKTRITPIWKLNIVEDGKFQAQDPLSKCMVSLHKLMNDRDIYINERAKQVDSVWVNNRKQTIITPVIVTGVVKAHRNSVVKDFQIFSDAMRSSNITNSYIYNLTQRVNQSADFVRRQLDNVVLKDRINQVIEGRVVFESGINLETGIIGIVRNPNIVLNRIPFMDLRTKLLTINSNQEIISFWTFKRSLGLGNLIVNGHLNKINLNNALRVNGDNQNVAGIWKLHNLGIEKDFHLFVGGKINGIKTNEFASLRKPKAFIGTKRLRSVRSANVIVNHLTNGVDFSHLVSKAVKLHSRDPQIIRGKLMFDSPLTDIKTLHTQLINRRVNIAHMLSYGVSRSRDQQMFSPVFFCQMSVQNLFTRRLFNGINLGQDLLTTNTFQHVYGNYKFNSDVTFKSNLDTNFVNGINLNTEAVRSYSLRPQRIMAHKVFTEPVFVSENIEMDDGSTIDNVDPSDLPHYIHGVHDTVFDGRTEFDELIITGNIESNHGINNFVVKDLPRKIWLKSQDQVIPKDIIFRGPVNVVRVNAIRVNGFNFPTDFVEISSKRPQIVMAPKYFTEAIVTKEFHTINGVRLNGVLDARDFFDQ